MKLLIVSFTFPPQVGGVAEVARAQASRFASRGNEVTVATEFDPSRLNEHAPKGVTVQQFKIGSTFGFRSAEAGALESYRKFVADERWELILVHAWRNLATDLAMPILHLSPAKKIMVSHGFDAHIWKPQPRPFWGIGLWLRTQSYVWRLPRMMKQFDQLVFLSNRRDRGHFFDHWLAEHLAHSRVSIIPNGVALSEFQRTQADFRKAYDIKTKFMLLNVANYLENKNQLATLHDFMNANDPDATLVFIGAEFNDYQAALARAYKERSSHLQRARVLFLEKLPKDMIYAAYKAATAFILSTKVETQPLVILDAMAAGIPFICTNVGCVGELPGGMVVSPGRQATWAICQILQDHGLRQKLGSEGRAACEIKYDWERVIDSFERLFTRLTLRESQ